MEQFAYKGKESIEILDKIGQGSYGVVYKGYLKEGDKKKLVAIKEIKKAYEGETIDPITLREICHLKYLKHPNIIELLDVIIDNKSIFLIYEYMETDLYRFIYDSKYNKKKLIKAILYKILNGLKYIHSKLLIHRDLSLKNILLSDGGNIVKISDFGLSRKIDLINPKYSKRVGTLFYMSPEMLFNFQDYTNRVDIWSVGCIFYEMIFKKTLFDGKNYIEQIHIIESVLGTPTNKTYPGIEKIEGYKKMFPNLKINIFDSKIEGLNKKELNLIKNMIVYNPEERISAQSAINDVSLFL